IKSVNTCDLLLPLTPSETEVLYDILDFITDNYQSDPGLDAFTRSSTDFIALFTKKEMSDIIAILYKLI
ncbi:unnamed protein product, partial [marine sediment metagenome]